MPNSKKDDKNRARISTIFSSYEPPTLKEFGSVGTLTQSGSMPVNEVGQMAESGNVPVGPQP